MTDYSDAIKNMVFSYSNLSTFETCKLLWKKIYIEKIERKSGFYAEVGLIFHETLEKYFKEEIESYQMLDYYKDNYSRVVVSDEPPFPKGIGEKYYQDGITFFSNFDFSRDDYDMLNVEEPVKTTISEIMFVIKPDLVMRDKETQNIILMDYKTSNPYQPNGTIKKDKILPYARQLQLYASLLWAEKQIEVNQMWLWFVRYNKIEKFAVSPEKAFNNLQKFLAEIEEIKNEKDFPANTSNKFFCDTFCSYSEDCLDRMFR